MSLRSFSSSSASSLGLPGSKSGVENEDTQALDTYLEATSFADAPAGVISAFFYQQFTSVYGGLSGLMDRISGNKDRVTYPLLLAFFTLFLYLATSRFRKRPMHEQGVFALIFVILFSG